MEVNNYKLTGDINMVLKARNKVTDIGFYYAIEGFIEQENKTVLYRTQGLDKLVGLEFEIYLPLDPNEAKRLICEFIMATSKGRFVPHHNLITHITNAPVLVQKRKAKHPIYDGEECYRLIFSDENFLLPTDDNCKAVFKGQLN